MSKVKIFNTVNTTSIFSILTHESHQSILNLMSNSKVKSFDIHSSAISWKINSILANVKFGNFSQFKSKIR